jgi:hypothetical protein
MDAPDGRAVQSVGEVIQIAEVGGPPAPVLWDFREGQTLQRFGLS